MKPNLQTRPYRPVRPFTRRPLFTRPLMLLAFGTGLGACRGAVHAQTPAGELRAGAATSNITPWLGVSINGGMTDRTATHIHDEIHARALALDDGETRLAIVVVDSCVLDRNLMDEAKRHIERHAGVRPDRVLISATHTHSAPTAVPVFQSEPDERYREFLTVRIADSVRRAVNNLEPAEIGWGFGSVPEHVFNRRWKMSEGKISPNPFGRMDQVKMNPVPGSPDLTEPEGPTDPELAVLSVRARDGRPIALLANYSLHYVGGTRDGEISADYFGMFADRIQALIGVDRIDPPFVGIMSNGTSGNINNIDFRRARAAQPPYEQMRKVAHRVAEEAFRVYGGLQYSNRVPLAARQQEVELATRKPTDEEVERAEDIVRKASPPPFKAVEAIYARETLLMRKHPEKVVAILQAFRIGDLGIAAIPAEVFVEIGLEIKKRSPLKKTFTIELANGYYGYLPTADHHARGGYETWRARSSYLETGAASRILETVLALLGGR